MLFIGVKPLTERELTPLLARHLPVSNILRLAADPSVPALSEAVHEPSLRFCFIEVYAGTDAAFRLIEHLAAAAPKLGIVVLLPSNHPDLILRCLRLGATEFLVPPFTVEQVQAVVQKLSRVLPQFAALSKPGKIYSVIPAKGACGATTIACALAYQWKRLGSQKVLLADLDPLTGLVSFLLKMKPQHSFADVLLRGSDIDVDLWKGMVTERLGVDILTAPELVLDAEIPLDDAGPILNFARHCYDVVIADAGAAYGEWSLSQANLADEVLLVTTNELIAIHSAQRVLKYLEANGIGRWKIKLIVNRYDQLVGPTTEVISSGLQMEIAHVLPSDYVTIQKALLEGKQCPPSSQFGRAVAALADVLSGRKEAVKRTPSFAGLLALFTRTST